MKKILVTGSNGFVGKVLCKLLRLKGYEVFETGDSKAINLCNYTEVDKLPVSDVIIHLAAKSYIPDSFINPADFYQNNIGSTINMLEKARKDTSKMIFLSTYVYGKPIYLPIDETHPRSPLNPYTQSKIICEDLCLAYNRDFYLPVIIFRPFNIYGPSQMDSFFIPTIISQLKEEIINLKDPNPKRDYVYIDDVVSAIESGILANFPDAKIFNIGSGISTSVKDVVEMIQGISNSTAKVCFSNQIRQGEVMDTVADIKKIKEELNWKPTTSLTEGLRKFIKVDSKSK